MSIPEFSTRETEVLRKAVTLLKEALDPKRIILFGSRAEGRHVGASDFDLAVDTKKPADGKAWEIQETVNDAIGLYKADIVYLPNVDPEFRSLVLASGKVVYEREN
jgi:predicted nucleotidyltransferase